jgi:hypothetical protein
VLDQVYRQSDNTALSDNLDLVRQGRINTRTHFKQDRDFQCIDFEIGSTLERHVHVLDTLCKMKPLPQFLAYTNDVVFEMNKAVQRIVNPRGELVTCSMNVRGYTCVARVGDPVMCQENTYHTIQEQYVIQEERLTKIYEDPDNHDEGYREEMRTHDVVCYRPVNVLGVSNGTLGKLIKTDKGKLEVHYNTINHKGNPCLFVDHFNDGRFATMFRTAYAITINKSQGSQFRNGVVILRSAFYKPHQGLLYTAISRFEKACVVLGMSEDFNKVLSGHKVFSCPNRGSSSKPSELEVRLKKWKPSLISSFAFTEQV